MTGKVDSYGRRLLANLGRCFLVAAAALTTLTTCWIEYLNWQAGGAIERKREQEPHSKWRLSSLAAELRAARERIRARERIPAERELSEEQQREARVMAAAVLASPGEKLALFLRQWGLRQTFLAMTVTAAAFLALIYSDRRRTAFYGWIIALGATTSFLALCRDYAGMSSW